MLASLVFLLLVYPEQIWYGAVTKNDVEEIIQSHIINNIPVERLKITHPRYNKDASQRLVRILPKKFLIFLKRNILKLNQRSYIQILSNY